MNIMLVGSGGREHAICDALAKSKLVSKILCVPGNAGTRQEAKCINLPLPEGISANANNGVFFIKAAHKYNIDFAIVGPEAPLCAGFADALWEKDIPVVGPRAKAARLEGSKDFAKSFMKKHGVACADSITVTNVEEAISYIEKKGAPIVIKADGLAAGKGVVVAATKTEALKAVRDFMIDAALGNAGKKLVLEEYLQGTEISILAAVSVTPQSAAAQTAAIRPFVSARDHKRLFDGAQGPNTGGMGAIAPVPDLREQDIKAFEKTILQPTLTGLCTEKTDYRGFIFFGLMLTLSGPKLLEYNVRLGDPETQAVLPLLDCDFAQLCAAILDTDGKGSLNNFNIKWKKGFVCAPVAVSGGYPQKYKTGCPISLRGLPIGQEILQQKAAPAKQHKNTERDAEIFFAGAENSQKGIVTSAGRVLCASAFGTTLEEARLKAYTTLQSIHFDGIFYRKDIGLAGAADSPAL